MFVCNIYDEMADEANDTKAECEYAENVKAEFLQVYREITEKLSEDTFSDYHEQLQSDDVVVKTDAAIGVFKTLLLNNLVSSLERMWNVQDISQSLVALQLLKDRFKDTTTPQWRPSGRSVREQTLPLRVKILGKREEYMENILEKQRQQLERIVAEIEENRRALDEHIGKRHVLSKQIDLERDKLDATEDQLARQMIARVDKL